MIAADVATFLPDDFLVKVDRASMAHGLEVRPPLLDHELLELAARIPSAYKVRGGQTKWIFKRAYRDALPGDVVRRPKHGLRGPDRRLAPRPPARDSSRRPSWTRGPASPTWSTRAPPAGSTAPTCAGTGRHGGVLWSLLILARWAERYLGPQPPESSAARGQRAIAYRSSCTRPRSAEAVHVVGPADPATRLATCTRQLPRADGAARSDEPLRSPSPSRSPSASPSPGGRWRDPRGSPPARPGRPAGRPADRPWPAGPTGA